MPVKKRKADSSKLPLEYYALVSPSFESGVIFTAWKDAERFAKQGAEWRRGVHCKKFHDVAAATAYLKEHATVAEASTLTPRTELAVGFPSPSTAKAEGQPPQKALRLSAGPVVAVTQAEPPLIVARRPSVTSAKSTETPGSTAVYVDGSCLSNGRRGAIAGWGVWFGREDARNVCGPVHGEQTNQRGELLAVREALRATDRAKPLIVKSDSVYAQKCVTDWAPKWLRNGWKNAKGDSVANQEIIKDILAELKGRQVVFEKVPAHAGVEGNEGADQLAKAGAHQPR